MNNIYGLIVSSIYIGLVILISNLFSKAGKEASRKFIHIMVSNWWIIAMIFFDNVIFACIMPAAFVVINYLSYRFNIIGSMEREEGKTLGTVYYAISLLIIVILTFGIWHKPELGLVGVLVMGYGDGFAAIAGRAIKSKEYKLLSGNTKTLAGTITMFAITMIIVSATLAHLEIEYYFLKSFIISTIITGVEAISIKGTDNLTVPILTTLLCWLVI